MATVYQDEIVSSDARDCEEWQGLYPSNSGDWTDEDWTDYFRAVAGDEIDVSSARERLAIYHRAMEAKSQRCDRLACHLLREAVDGLAGIPYPTLGDEKSWWDSNLTYADSVYEELLEFVSDWDHGCIEYRI